MQPYVLERNIFPTPKKKIKKSGKRDCLLKNKTNKITVCNETQKKTKWMWFHVASQNTKLRLLTNNFQTCEVSASFKWTSDHFWSPGETLVLYPQF